MERILITGAGGYIGSNAAEYFVKQGYDVTGMVHNRIAPRFAQCGAKAIHADLNELDSLDALFANDYDYVLHVAARASDVGRDELFRIPNHEAV
jgi:nucleoside-diphosphate-sugar epimerase